MMTNSKCPVTLDYLSHDFLFSAHIPPRKIIATNMSKLIGKLSLTFFTKFTVLIHSMWEAVIL